MARIGLGLSILVCALVGCEAKKPVVQIESGSARSAQMHAAGSAAYAEMRKQRDEALAPDVALFNGKDLTGWVVTECETEVKDGVLLLKSGEGWVRTEKKYGDFVLSWECRNLKPNDYDSGVHFRAELPAGKAHWPKKFQVNLKTGNEGNLTNNTPATSTGHYKNGDWNKFKLKVQGSSAEMEINGKRAWITAGIDVPEGYIGLQSEVTAGGPFEFRNIMIKELAKP